MLTLTILICAPISGPAAAASVNLAASNTEGDSDWSDAATGAIAGGVPSAPATPRATWGDGTATLTWTAPHDGGSPITDYDYQTRNHSDSGAWTEYEETNTSTATSKILNLTNGKIWRLRIRAGNAVGDSKWSWPFVEVVVGSPAPLAAPTLVSLGGGQFNVSWTAPSGNGSAVTGYSIWYRRGTGDWTEVPDISATSHTLTLTAGQTYSVGVEAHNARGGSNPSTSEFSGATTSTTAALNVSLAASDVKETTATLTLSNWKAAWWHKKTSGPGTATCAPVASGTTTATLSGLAGGTSYTFTAYSDSACTAKITSAATDAEFSTVGLTAGSVTGAGATLTLSNWKAAWWHKKTSGPGTATCAPVASGTTTATLSGLAGGTSYTWTVYSASSCGANDKIADVDFTSAATAPLAPTGLTVSPGSAEVALSWTSGGDGGSAITKWQYVKKAGTNNFETTWTDIPGSGVLTTSHTVTGLTNGTTYKFKVRAVNALGNGTESAESAAVMPAAFCGRTPEVRDAIVAAVSGKTSCSAIVDTDLAAITTLNIKSKSTLTALQSGDFAGLTALTHLDLDGSGLTSVPAGVFDNLTKLEHLNFDNNDLASLPAGIFDNLTKLTFLDFTNNYRLTSLPAGIFDNLTKLDSLNLKSTVSSLRPGVFDSLRKLTFLDFTNNYRLTSLPAGIFDNLTKLDSLNLKSTVSSLRPGVFDSLRKLTYLSLWKTGITALPDGVFDNLTKLEVLNLSQTGLANNLPDGVFDNLTKLEILLIGHSVTTPPAGVFDNLVSLEGLYMFGPKLTCLPFIPNNVQPLTYHTPGSAACGAGVTMGATGVSVGAGATNVYTVVLDAYPRGDVTVTPASAATGTATVSGALTFTQDNWDTVQSVTVTGVAAGSTTLSHTVDGGGYGGATAADVAATVTAASLAASAVTASTATLTIANYTGNWYYKYTSPSGGVCSASQTGTSANLSNLTGGTSYTFAAYSDSACSTSIAVAPAFTTVGTAPSAPGTPTATWGDGTVTLKWTAPHDGGSPITDYDYQTRNHSDSWPWIEYEASNTSTATTKALALTNGKIWRLRVRAGNVVGDSNWSWPFVEEVVGSPAPVAAPTLVSLGGGQFNVSWTAPSGNGSAVTGYSIWHKQESSNSWTEVTGIAASATSHTLTGLTTGQTYSIGVEAHNARGGNNPSTSEFSGATTSITTAPVTLPSAPARPTATWGDEMVTLTWTAPDNGGSPITDYDYQTRNHSDSGAWTEYEENNTSTATSKILNLTNGKIWRLRIRAGNAVGDSNWSSPFVEVVVGSPAPVAAPSLTSLSGGQVKVDWMAPFSNRSTVTGYSIWHKQESSNSWTEVTGIAGSATSHTLTLTAGQAYAIGVEAHNARGGSNPSTSEFGGATTSVSLEVTLMASAVTHEGATLTMGNHTGSWYYKYTVPSGGVCSALQSGTSADVTGLAGNTSYTYKAYNDSTCMTELAAAAPFLTKPAKPDKPTATGGVGSGKLELSSSVAGGSSALTKWQYTKDNGTTWSDISVMWSWTTRLIHVVTGLTDGTNYTFQVRAVNDTGAGPASEASEPAQSTSTAPDPVTAVTVLHNGSSLAVSWWPAAARADSYHVTYSDNNGTSWQLAALEHTGTSLTINGVDNSKTYIVRVRAKNAAGYSGWTNSGAVTSPAPDPVASVTLVHQGNSLDVTWPAAARAASYHVTYTDDNAISWQLAALEHAGTSLTINSVDSSKTYIVGVRAKNAGGSSSWTSSAAATFAVPDPVASVTVVHNGSSLSVTWPAAARANSYHVTYTGDNAISWQLGALAHSGTSLTISGVDSSKTYIVAVRAKNAAGYSGWVNSAPAAPPALSVADATAVEPGVGQSANLDFVVTLNRAASGTVTVDYATSDGTATAGADYTAASGTLTFQPGDTSKTVAVVVLNDSHNEGSETMTLTLSNATGAVIDSNAAQASGTITNKDPVPQAWISRFGRTVADQVLDAVDIRMGSTPTPGLGVTLAGERLDWWADSDEGQPMAQQAVAQLAQWLTVGSGDNGDLAVRTVTGSELLAESSFALSSRTAGGALLSFWGRGAVTSFEGREGELSLDGEVTTWMLGTDWSWGQWPDGQGVTRRSTAGLLLSRSRADGGYAGTGSGTDNRFSGDVVSTLTGVFPWGRYRFTDRLEAWGAVGYGQGELEVTPKQSTGQDGATLTTDLNLWLAAGGLRGTLLDGGNDGITLTGKTDVMAVVTSSAQVTGQDGNLAAAEATVTRLRLGLEAQRPFSFGSPEADSRATLTPSLELGLRHDGGDAETGFGLDLGGGITLSHPARGLQAELRGRGLLTHAAEGFRDQGFSGSLSWQQRPDSDLGAMLSLSQTMGGSSSGGADALLSRVNLEGLAASDDEGNGLTHQRLDLQLSYGFLALGDHFTLTPELGLGLYNSGRDYRIGWSLTRLVEDGESFALSFDVTRRESSKDGTAPEHGVELNLDTRF